MTGTTPLAVEMLDICKQYPGGIVANDRVSLRVRAGEIHAVIGENGAGKTTLMNILYGRVRPDSGRVRVRGADARIAGPSQAIAMGIGLVSQHTTIIPALTLIENAMLGCEPTRAGVLEPAEALRRLQALADTLDANLDWTARAEGLSVATLQKAEILKALYRGASILILDEPTATLAPHEAQALFGILHGLTGQGATILLVTHKLQEVMDHSAAVTVLRKGRTVGERRTADTYTADLMSLVLGSSGSGTPVPLVDADPAHEPGEAPRIDPWQRGPGSEMLPMDDAEVAGSAPLMELRDLTVLNDRKAPAIRGVSLAVRSGEILGVAGVDGSGQRELAEAMVGVRRPADGSVTMDGRDIGRLGVRARMRRGVRFIPEDRQTEGLIGAMSVAENLALGRCRNRVYRSGMLLSPRRLNERAEGAMDDFHIQAGSPASPAADLSGGNQQKVVLARALSGEPRLVVAMQPTRGLDIGATTGVYSALDRVRRSGAAAVVFSLDVDELLAISDRVAVLYSGSIAGVLPRAQATADEIGRLMLGGSQGPAEPGGAR